MGLEPENFSFLSRYAHHSTTVPTPIVITETGVFNLTYFENDVFFTMPSVTTLQEWVGLPFDTTLRTKC